MRQFNFIFYFFFFLFSCWINVFSKENLPKKHIVMSDAHPITVWEKSVDNSKGVILLHHGRTWSSLPDFDLQVEGEDLSLMDGFNDQGYSVLAMDARGYGETPRDESGWNTPNKASKDLSIVLKWLYARSGEKIHVWGWSMGSMLSQLAAQQYPENFASLTLFGYPAGQVGYPYSQGLQIMGNKQYSEPLSAATTTQAAASDFIVPGSISQKAIDEYVRHALRSDPIRADWNQLQQYNNIDAQKVTVPVLMLQAEFDPLADTEIHAKVFSAFPNANKQWIVLKGGDHAALLEKSRGQLIDATISFIEWLDK